MKEQIKIIEDMFSFLEDDYYFEYFEKTPSSTKFCKSINYYLDNLTFEIQLHKNLTYFYLNSITEKDESFSITSFNNKLIYCNELNAINLSKAKIKLLKILENN